jgi:hypothetical protein
MYDVSLAWGTDSVGAQAPSSFWYLAEGCTDGGTETYLLLLNPNASQVSVDLDFMTPSGPKPGPQDVSLPAESRVTIRLNDHITDYSVSTQVTSTGGGVVCERAMYGADRVWGTCSIGATSPADTWYLAEGCTGEGFETWVLVENPGSSPVSVDLDFMTPSGPKPGPQDVSIPAHSRLTFNVGDYVIDWSVSTQVTSTGGGVVCERAMYGADRTWAHDSIGCSR